MSFRAFLNLHWVWLLLSAVTVGCTLGPTPVPTASPLAETWNLPPPTPPSTLPELIAALSDSDIETRIVAAQALGAMGPDAETAVPALTRNLYYDVPHVRTAAAWALGEIGPAAKPAVPVLIVVLLTGSDNAREAAAVALGKIQDSTAVPALASGLYDESPWVRIFSAEAIARLTGQSFPGTPPSKEGGYILDESGEAIIVLAAREWWRKDGWQQDWLRDVAITPVSESTPVPSAPTSP